jgi:amidase
MSDGPDELARLDATAQAELVRRGEVGPGELVEAARARIERLNPALNAVVTDIEPAPPQPGPLAGVPLLVKDLMLDVAGTRLTNASRWLAANVSTDDHALVSRYRRAGLVIVGKTNTCEFGLSPTVESALFGPARNPWDPTRSTGGSSGGSAAAVAAGLVPLAHGNDMGGSIRYPAAWCGVFGLKPSRGRVPADPDDGDAVTRLVSQHVLTRSVRDSAAVLDAVAGPFLEQVDRPPGRLRIAVRTTPRGGQAVDPRYVAAVDEAAALLAELGHEVDDGAPDGLDDPGYGPSMGRVYGGALAWILDAWARRMGGPPGDGDIEPQTRFFWEMGRQVTAADYLLGVESLQRVARTVAAWFEHHDVWITPTLGSPPPPLGELVGTEDDPLAGNRNAGRHLMFDGELANVTGHPAMSIPFGWDGDGLPIGLHVLGRFGDEATLLRLATQLEEARPWADRWPDQRP